MADVNINASLHLVILFKSMVSMRDYYVNNNTEHIIITYNIYNSPLGGIHKTLWDTLTIIKVGVR